MRGGARLVHSVDSSGKAVSLTERNVELNYPGDERHKAFAQDAFDFLDNIEPDAYDLIILDPPGAADMELMSHLTTEMVETYIDSINASDAVVTDCNLSEDVLRYLAERCAVPLYVDATSAAKAMKIKAMLDVSRSMPRCSWQ